MYLNQTDPVARMIEKTLIPRNMREIEAVEDEYDV